MASSSSSAPSFFSHSWTYDVFLSFRGEDTRRTFVDHLYTALERQGINTYKDDVTLPRGESISLFLKKAIGESQIAVIVFSVNYADSSWCLDELAYIMESRDTRGQMVMPIFYDVDPSEVRKQKRKYEEAFTKHELENKTKVESWRKALVDASNISGWEPKNIANGHEAKAIKQIVAEIAQKLCVTSSANENMIGIRARLQSLKSELQIGSGGVHMIGIWGVGGGGKTTLASSIYNEISSKFDSCCFVENIREESGRYGLQKLQKKILSELEVNKVGGGRCLINNMFRNRKVFLVLDDVDRLDQLNALAESHSWFGEGSRIIITTRDKHLLTAHKVDVIHNISLLNRDEAIKLFCKHAPRDNRPVEDYEHLSKEVVSYAGGLPLALTVLGSFLCDKDISEWKSALVRLKDIPDTDIVETLKISFDGLKPVEKDLFLDIACFFRKKNKELAMEILDAFGFHPVIGVKVLIQKALITISDGRFDMHDLVQEMGQYIVRGERPNNLEKHSRLWKEEDVLKVCAMDATAELDMIEAIKFEYSSKHQLQRYKQLPPIVANTKNLRWIEWEGDLASPLLTNFPQRTLCRLVLSNSLQKQLWEGYKLLPNLKTVELWDLDNLIMTPDFDGLPNLERFVLSGCGCLEEIHPSIGCLERLVFLSKGSCCRLKMFPPITRLKKLETLTFFGCPELFTLSATQQNMENLPHLLLDNSEDEASSYIESSPNFFIICWRCGCTKLPGVECCLEEPCLPGNNMKPYLRDNMNHIGLRFFLKDLRNLNLGWCSLGDEEMGSAVWELPNLQEHNLSENKFSRLNFSLLRFLKDLRNLNLGWCSLGDEEMGSAVWELPNLQELNLSENKFSRLNFSLLRLPRLKLLNVSWCKSLVELSELPSSIAVVDATHCISLETFGDISNCKWLWYVLLQMGNKLGVDILLDNMLQGNASEEYFINIILEHQIPKGFVGRQFKGRTFTLHLSDAWYNEFCGFQICVVTQMLSPYINIVIKQEVDEDSRSEICQESDEVLEPEYDETTTYVGYVSFGSLRDTTFSNSSYTMITIELDSMYGNSSEGESYVSAELVPRKSKGDEMQTTKVAADFSEFWDKQREDGNTFTIQHDSKSSISGTQFCYFTLCFETYFLLLVVFTLIYTKQT